MLRKKSTIADNIAPDENTTIQFLLILVDHLKMASSDMEHGIWDKYHKESLSLIRGAPLRKRWHSSKYLFSQHLLQIFPHLFKGNSVFMVFLGYVSATKGIVQNGRFWYLLNLFRQQVWPVQGGWGGWSKICFCLPFFLTGAPLSCNSLKANTLNLTALCPRWTLKDWNIKSSIPLQTCILSGW